MRLLVVDMLVINTKTIFFSQSGLMKLKLIWFWSLVMKYWALLNITNTKPSRALQKFIVSLRLSSRCFWAGRLCVLRVSMSSCWAAGTETASSARLSPTSTPSLLRTPWTWFDGGTAGRKLTCVLELGWWRVRSQGEWVARFCILYFLGGWGRDAAGSVLIPPQTPKDVF